MGGKLRKSFFWEEVEVENAQKWIKVHNKTSEFEHFTTPERLLVSIQRKKILLGIWRAYYLWKFCQESYSDLSLNWISLKGLFVCTASWNNQTIDSESEFQTAVRHKSLTWLNLRRQFWCLRAISYVSLPLSSTTNFFWQNFPAPLSQTCCKNTSLGHIWPKAITK